MANEGQVLDPQTRDEEAQRTEIDLLDFATPGVRTEQWVFRGPGSALAAWLSMLRTSSRLSGGTWTPPGIRPLGLLDDDVRPPVKTTALRGIPPGRASPVQVNRYTGSRFVPGAAGREEEARVRR